MRGHFIKRRLDLSTEKKELIKDIISISGKDELDALASEITGFGDPLDETLESMSLPRLRRIHGRMVTGELDDAPRDDLV